MKRGEVYHINRSGQQIGSEIWTGRPALVVGVHGNACEVVYLTTQPKPDMPEHVTITSGGTRSTVMCEQITTLDKSRFGQLLWTATEYEVQRIDKALAHSLSLHLATEAADDAKRKIAALEAELSAVKTAYAMLLDGIMARSRA